MKPEWCPQWAWDEARKIAISLNGFAQSDDFQRIARALLDAHQRGRREGMEEAAKVADSYGNTWTGTRDAMQASQEAAVDDKCEEIAAAIRAKMEEQP